MSTHTQKPGTPPPLTTSDAGDPGAALNPIRPRSANKIRTSLDEDEEELPSGGQSQLGNVMRHDSAPSIVLQPKRLTIEDFELVHLLGQGGVGNVWYAVKKDTKQDFAGILHAYNMP